MARVADLPPEQLTDEQKRIHEEIAGPRGGVVRGPFAIWMRQPAIADAANRFGNTLRLSGKLDRRLFEMMILIVARHWSAQYEWYAHEQTALKMGLAPAIVEALRAGERPAGMADDETLVYDLITELNATRDLSQASYDRGVARFGIDLMIELMTAAGFYTMVAMMLKAFDAPVPGGERPLP